MKYEWKVIEHLHTQPQYLVDEEKQKLLADGFVLFRSLFQDDRSNIHFNLYRKQLKKVWTDIDIIPNLSVKDEEGNVFTIIQLRNEVGETKGWLFLIPTDGVAYKPCDGYFGTHDIVKYLNENGFTNEQASSN